MKRQPLPLAILAVALGCALACDRVPSGAITHCQAITVVPAVTRTDILFVVDDSDSMREEQQNLADNFDAFISRLNASPFKNDFQIGITTTSVDLQRRDPNGNVLTTDFFLRGPNIRNPYPKGALISVDPATGAYLPNGPKILTASSPTLIQDFKNNVKVGIDGSGKEQGLLAAKLALTDRIADGSNAGFLRPGARLAIVIVSDADDCSDPNHQVTLDQTELCYDANAKAAIAPVGDFVTFLRGPIGGEKRDVVVAAIAGVDPVTKLPAVTCAGPEDKADRYKSFVDGFGSNGLIDDICNPSFRGTLDQIAGLIEPPESVNVEPAPSDPRMLSVRVSRSDGTKITCALAVPGDPNPAAADAVYVPAADGQPARINLQNACKLQQGDQVTVELLCAG